MKTVRNKTASLVFCALSAVGLPGCNEYWWTRGQPPSVQAQIDHSLSKLRATRAEYGMAREEFAKISNELEESLVQTVASIQKNQSAAQVASGLQKAEGAFVKLEGKVSVGSRPALGELAGQLRMLSEAAAAGKQLEFPAVGLFASRTFAFLANELSVPAPV